MSGFQLVASLVGSLVWPVAVVVAVWVLRRPLAAALGRTKRVEAAGIAVELAEVEQAREDVEQGLAKAEPLDAAEVDELVRSAAQLGWHLANLGTGTSPDVVVDRSGEKPVVRSPAEEAFREAAVLASNQRSWVGPAYFYGRHPEEK
ncbi:hypothetical protein [Nonomuraea sp. B19D2]|uniref:hypothetical protein n=1 Tax=Nonomuraea sp. B19D2 TaxID=3159561 RepID=UPI0032DB8F18